MNAGDDVTIAVYPAHLPPIPANGVGNVTPGVSLGWLHGIIGKCGDLGKGQVGRGIEDFY